MQEIFNQELKNFVESQKGFEPLLKAFKEIKNVLDDNFVDREFYTRIRVFRPDKKEVLFTPYLNIFVQEKIKKDNEFFLLISMHRDSYMMGYENNEIYFIKPTEHTVDTSKNEDIEKFQKLEEAAIHCKDNYIGFSTAHHVLYSKNNKISLAKIYSKLIHEHSDKLKALYEPQPN
jgi:hypothetical protein